MDDRPVLFSEKNQQIYELNQISAFIWCKLLDQNAFETIGDELSELGLDRQEARNVLSASFASVARSRTCRDGMEASVRQRASDPVSAANNQYQSLE